MKRYLAIDPPQSIEHPSGAVVVVRKQIQTRIINEWMVLAGIIGAAIVVMDRLTRAPDPEWGLPLQPLEYEPNRAAFLLAAVTIPLMFAYARRARVSLIEGLFLWFTFCTAAYMKDFSYLRLPGMPIFVTDIVLIVLLFSIYILPRGQQPHQPMALNIFLILYVAAGLVSAAQGFWGDGDPKLVLRDSALVGYALFLVVGYQLFRNWLSIRRLAVWFLLGTALNVLNGAALFVAAPEERRFLLGGNYALISLVIVLIATANRLIQSKAGWVLAVYFSLGLFLANMRSIFVSLGGVLFLALVVPGLLSEKIRSAFLTKTLITASLVACLLALLFFHVKAGREFGGRVADEFESGVFHSGDDANWQFRLLAWKEAWRRFENSPVEGEGFGVPFAFGIWDNDPRPHNAYLTVLYKMGLVGSLPFFGFLVCFFWRGLRAVHRNCENRRVVFLQIVILAQVCFCLHGAANLLLESPFLASLFWAGMGIGLRAIRKLDLERLVARAYPCALKKQSGLLETQQA